MIVYLLEMRYHNNNLNNLNQIYNFYLLLNKLIDKVLLKLEV